MKLLGSYKDALIGFKTSNGGSVSQFTVGWGDQYQKMRFKRVLNIFGADFENRGHVNLEQPK